MKKILSILLVSLIGYAAFGQVAPYGTVIRNNVQIIRSTDTIWIQQDASYAQLYATKDFKFNGDVHITDSSFLQVLSTTGANVYGPIDQYHSGTNQNSYVFSQRADSGGTHQQATLEVIFGADPYWQFSAPNDAGTATPVFDLHDNVIAFTSDNAVDIGSAGANRAKNIYLAGDLTGTDIWCTDTISGATGYFASSGYFGTGVNIAAGQTYKEGGSQINLSDLASSTSAELAGMLSNETGTNLAVFSDDAVLHAPAINLDNSQWITASDGVGGTTNLIKIDSANRVVLGATLTIGSLYCEADAGNVLLWNQANVSAINGDTLSGRFSVDDEEILRIQSVADGAGGLISGRTGVIERKPIRTVTDTTSITDLDYAVLCDATSSGIVVNLPTPASAYNRIYRIKAINVSNAVWVQCSSGNIDGTLGSTGVQLTTIYDAIELHSNGTNWYIW